MLSRPHISSLLPALLVIGAPATASAGVNHLLCGLIPQQTYDVFCDGTELESGLLSSTSGTLLFQSPAGGEFEIVPAGPSDVPPARDRIGPLAVAPNPTSGRARLIWSAVAEGSAVLLVHDAQGRRVSRSTVPVHEGRNEREVDLARASGSRLPAGVYYLRLQDGGISRSARIIVIR